MSNLSNIQPIIEYLNNNLTNNFKATVDGHRFSSASNEQIYNFTISKNHTLPFTLIITADCYSVPTGFRITFENGPIATKYINEQQKIVNQIVDILTKKYKLTEAHIINAGTYVL